MAREIFQDSLMQTTTPIKNSINRCSLFLVPLVLICFALFQSAEAVSPPPDGGYPGSNTAEGQDALFNLTTGTYNTALGFWALRSNRTGSFNTATGAGALLRNTGDGNTATGAGTLLSNTIGVSNTATGESALFSNAIGNNNTANGASALENNATGNNNTATGVDALWGNIAGANNTAAGVQALFENVTGFQNTANGVSALKHNTGGANNTAAGFQALLNTRGGNNTGIGTDALFLNSTGSFNTALGGNAGSNLTTGNNNIDIGYNVSGPAGESGTIRIGDPLVQSATYVAGISGATVPAGVPVIADTSGHLGTIISSQRFKDEIKPMDKVSEAILALKPVTFRYKKELDPEGIPQFGFVAEEVAKVSPDLVARDRNGDITTVRYEAVNAMLLNEFLKEHQKVQRLEAALTAMDARLKAQHAKIERVNSKVELTKSAQQTALNNQ
jgi:endosialidase-like protein